MKNREYCATKKIPKVVLSEMLKTPHISVRKKIHLEVN